jgi:hypothetical protein
VNGETDISRFTTTMSEISSNLQRAVREQQREVEEGLGTVSAALDRAVDRISALLSGAPVPATAAAATAPALAVPGGVLSVRLVTTPLPVTVTNFPQPSGLSTFAAAAGAIGGGIGSFFGNIFGGLFASIAGFADLVVLVSGAITVIAQVTALLRNVREFFSEIVYDVRGLITLAFDELTAAGVLPVSRLIASILVLIDRGVTLVLMHIQPIIIWAERLVETVATWLGDYLSRAIAWVGRVINALATFLPAFATYLIDAVVRPAIHRMATDFVAALVSGMLAASFALTAMLIAAFDHLYATTRRALAEFRNSLPWISPVPLPPVPAAPDYGAVAEQGMARARGIGARVAAGIMGPAPAAPGAVPQFRMPGLRAPELRLPDMPGAAPQLERLLTTPPAQPAAAPAAQAPTVTGGITVQIRAETVSMDNAEATARAIGQHLMDELTRLAQTERFARGLPTGPAA